MLPLRNPPKGRTMLSDRLTLVLALTIFSVSNAAVVFDLPPSGGATVTFPENKAPGEVIYRLQATDAGGNPPDFSLNLINCTDNSAQTQNFTINNLDELIVPLRGLDAENCTQFIFTFNVTAGASHATSDPLTVIVTDINDNSPNFTKLIYYGEVWKNDIENSLVNANDPMNATDPDISKLEITYAIAGAQTTFAINVTTGTVYVANPSGLAALASPTMLTIQATDGGLMSTATLNITVHDDPCTITPCQNGGACSSFNRSEQNCTCLGGYSGTYCENVDYCYVNHCQFDGTCINLYSDYNCSCVPGKGGKNCTDNITTTTTTTTTQTTTTTTLISTRTTPSQPSISSSSATTIPKTQTPRSAATTITATKRNAWLGLGIGLPVACAITIIGAIIKFAQKTKKENYQCQCQSVDVTKKDDKNLHRTQQINL